MHFFTQFLCLQGVVTNVRPGREQFDLRCRSGDEFTFNVDSQTNFSVLRNLGDEDQDRVAEPSKVQTQGSDATRKVDKYIKKGLQIVVKGLYQEHESEDGNHKLHRLGTVRARDVFLLGSEINHYNFELTQWWLSQISSLADRWLDMLFGDSREYASGDFAKFYQTDWNIIGMPGDRDVQESATLSRLIYGLSSAYLLTGDERYFRAAKAGVQYQRETFLQVSHDGKYCFWAFGKRKLKNNRTRLMESSQNDDDKGAVPLYEQIYALAGLTQYYRITNDWDVLVDIRRSVAAFNKFFLDPLLRDDSKAQERKAEDGPLWDQYKKYYSGYYSHIDYSNREFNSVALGKNQSRKNWNSVGDHIPAYLINLILALDPIPAGCEGDNDLTEFVDQCRMMLVATSQTIVDRFPDTDPQIPYVNERFMADWTPDHSWSWQQNRAVVGHNLKIAWNLTRVANYFLAQACDCETRGNTKDATIWANLAKRNMELANDLGKKMVNAGIDQFRGGCFDCVEREPTNDLPLQFAWGNTKDFWQQEQVILAYLILYGNSKHDGKCDEYLTLAREAQAIWNLFFLDQDQIGINFRINDTGDPVVAGQYSDKGGHAISGYHAFELNYLAHIYIRSYVNEKNDSGEAAFKLHFRPDPRNRDQLSINVLPDFFRPGELVVAGVTVNGVRRSEKSLRPNDYRIDFHEDELGSDIVVEFRTRIIDQK